MATNPDDIHLSAAERQLLAELADKKGKDWEKVLREALMTYAHEGEKADQAKPIAHRSRIMADILSVLAERGTFTHIPDPARWQQEMRQERMLPERG